MSKIWDVFILLVLCLTAHPLPSRRTYFCKPLLMQALSAWAARVNGTMDVWWVITQVGISSSWLQVYDISSHSFGYFFFLIYTLIHLFSMCCLGCCSNCIVLYYKRQHKLSNQFLIINSTTSRNAFFSVITTIESHKFVATVSLLSVYQNFQ